MSHACSRSASESKFRSIVGGCTILLCALYVLRLGPMPLYPMWNTDQAVYLVTAKALSSGSGNRLICFPDEPPSTKYPIGYPLAISVVIKTFGVDATGVTALRLVSVFAALSHFLLNIKLFRHYFSRRLSLLAALTIAVSPLTFEFAGELMAEELFGAVWALVLILTKKAVGYRADQRRAALLALALGIAAGSALLLRTIGIAIIAGLVLGLALNRRWKLSLTAGLAATLTVAPWILWSTHHGGGTFRSYSAENAIAFHTPLKNALSITTDVLPVILFPPSQTRAFESLLPQGLQFVINFTVGVAATIVGLIGARRLSRKRDIVLLSFIPYLLIILFWWWEPSRFLLPAYPILAILFLSGLKVIGESGDLAIKKRFALATQGLCAIAIIGGLAVDSTRLHAVWRYHHWLGASNASYWRATKEALDWIGANTSPDTLCVSPQPEAVYLFTNRRTVDLPLTADAMELMFKRLPVDTIVLATLRPNFESPAREEFACSGIKSVVRRSPRLLRRVWCSSSELVEIYRVDRPASCSECQWES